MGLDRERIAATYAAGAGDGLVGSGYFVTDGLVLTAAHGVGSIGDPAQVKRLDGDWLPAKVVWRGETSDSALVELALPSDRPRFHTAIRWGRIEGPDRVSCTAVGFPWAEARPENLRDSHQLYGDIAPLTGRKSRRYAINVTTAPPAGRPPGRSPWAGMSGAAVTAGGVVVGVVVIDPERFGADRLDAVPIEEIFAEEAFAERVGGGGL
ncbi:MAG TPA: S1C family serine protease, partial [Actinomycetota bacterium]|nr:S1C family serine protease [Actinomycetota bacterium]